MTAPNARLPGGRLPVRLHGSARWQGRALYALANLLRPLGLAPDPDAREAPVGLSWGPQDGEPAWLHIDADHADPVVRPPDTAPCRVAWHGETWPVPFKGGWTQEDGSPSGDLIGSAWYWLSGEDERQTRQRDPLGRVRASDLLLVRLGLAERPVVDAYRDVLAAQLVARGVPLRRRSWDGHAWCLCATHDIDYVRKWRPGIVYREAVEYLLMDHRHVAAGERLRRAGRALAQAVRPGDPFRQAMEQIRVETEARGGRGTMFFKAGAHGPYDVPYRVESRFVRRQVWALRDGGHDVGLHPSFFAYRHPGYLAAEKSRLEAVVGRPAEAVRTHYLRFDPAVTPGLLANAGFRLDSTLGFTDRPGFRRGTCHPFQLYDPVEGKAMDLWEMPLALMESALFNRLGLTTEEASERTTQLMETVRRFGGVLVGLWHNTLWDELDFPGWGRHFTDSLDAARDGGAAIRSLSSALDDGIG